MADEFEEDDVFHELTQDVLQKIAGKDALGKKIRQLDFSDRRFQLERLSGLQHIDGSRLTDIDLSENLLQSIQELNAFRSLKIINASHNYITEVRLDLPKLQELDLSQNTLKVIPPVSKLPNLTTLILCANDLSGSWEELENGKNLQTLDLSKNRFDLNPREFTDGLKCLKKIEKLTTLKVAENPFCNVMTEYQVYIISALQKLEKLDGEVISKEMRNQIKKEELPDLSTMMDETDLAPRASKKHTKKKDGVSDSVTDQIATLRFLNTLLEDCFGDPSRCIANVSNLSFAVDNIVAKPSIKHAEMFVDWLPDDLSGKSDAIDEFLQNAMLLMERQPAIKGPLLRCIAKLSVIAEESLGQKCLGSLQNMMSAGSEFGEQIVEVLQDLVIPDIKSKMSEDVSETLIEGLAKLAEDPNLGRALTQIIPTMGMWLEERNPSDQVIALMAAAANNPKNAVLMRDAHVPQTVLVLLDDRNIEDEEKRNRFMSLLRIVEQTSRFDPQATKIYKNQSLHHKLLQALAHVVSGQNAMDMKASEKAAKIIDCIDGLCTHDFGILKESNQMFKFFDTLISITQRNRVDPVLLCATLNALYGMLHHPEEKEDRQKKITSGLSGVAPILQYLGGKKYQTVCELAEQYQQGAMIEGRACPLSSLANRVIINLFIVIIKLVTYFCEHAIGDPHCAEVSNWLNQAQREHFLFQCLEVPSDDVKLAVVNCLDKVALNELDSEEVGFLVRMVGSYKNLGAGRTEEVLSVMFGILERLASDRSTAGYEFRRLHAEQCIADTLDILTRNQERNTAGDRAEEKEKSLLSQACVKLLKTVSQYPELRRYMRNRNVMATVKRVLKAEEKYSSEGTPAVEIERTWAGRSVEYLLQCMMGNDALDAAKSVAFRVVQRIGDVLEGRKDQGPLTYKDLAALLVGKKDGGQGGKEDGDMNDEQGLSNEEKEGRMWRIKSIQEVEAQETEEEYEDRVQQHHVFSSYKGLDRLIMFLLNEQGGEGSRNLIAVSNLLDDAKELSRKEKDAEDMADKEQREQLEAKELDLHIEDEDGDNERGGGRELLMQAFQEEMPDTLASQAAAIGEDALSVELKSKHGGAGGGGITSKVDSQTKSQRMALIVAAALRCIHAAVVYAPKEQTRAHAVEQLRRVETLRLLTSLSASTGWTESSVGAKYLAVVYHSLHINAKSLHDEPSSIGLYDIVTKAMQQILSLLQRRIRIANDHALTDDEEALCLQLGRVAYLICKQVQHVPFSDESLNVQKKVTEYVMLQLFPRNVVSTFISIILYDMQLASGFSRESAEVRREAIQRRDTIRENVTGVLAEYLHSSMKNRYDVLEEFTKASVFDGIALRQTYVQELLDMMQMKKYRSALENYMYQNSIFERRERVIELAWAEVSPAAGTFENRLVVLSNEAFYILKRPRGEPCSVCSPDQFCPAGPLLVARRRYHDLKRLVIGVGDQFMATVFHNTGFRNKGDSLEITVFPQYGIRDRVLNIFERVLRSDVNTESVEFEQDVLTEAVMKSKLGVTDVKQFTFCHLIVRGNRKYRVCILTGQEFIVAEIYTQYWCLEPTYEDIDQQEKALDEDESLDADAMAKKKEALKKMRTQRQKEAERKREEATHKLIGVDSKESLNSLSQVEFGPAEDATLRLTFGKKKYMLLFGCDASREQWRRGLVNAVSQNIDSWQRVYKNMADGFDL